MLFCGNKAKACADSISVLFQSQLLYRILRGLVLCCGLRPTGPHCNQSAAQTNKLQGTHSSLGRADIELLNKYKLYEQVPDDKAESTLRDSLAGSTEQAFAFCSTSGQQEDDVLEALSFYQREKARYEREKARKAVQRHLHNLAGTLDSFFSDFFHHVVSKRLQQCWRVRYWLHVLRGL